MTTNRYIKPSVGAVIFKGTDVLLIQRGKPPYKNHWSIPGGKIEFGETMHDALHREIMEETGVEIEIISTIDAFEALPVKEGDPHYVMIDFAAKWVSGEPVAGDDAAAAEFVPFDEALKRLEWDKTRLALQQAKTAIERATNYGK